MRLTIHPKNVGENCEILYAEDSPLTDQSPRLQGRSLKTKAIRVLFRVNDLSGKYETGDEEVWEHTPRIRFEYLNSSSNSRRVKILVVPDSEVRYTLDMTEPRNGVPYEGPIELGEKGGQLSVYAECRGQHRKEVEKFGPIKGEDIEIDITKPAIIISNSGFKDISSYAKIHKLVDLMIERGATLSEMTLLLGQNRAMITLQITGQEVTGEKIRRCLSLFREDFPSLEEKMSLRFKTARFVRGDHAQEFIKLGEIHVAPSELRNE